MRFCEFVFLEIRSTIDLTTKVGDNSWQYFFLARLKDHENSWKYTNASGWYFDPLGCMNNSDSEKKSIYKYIFI